MSYIGWIQEHVMCDTNQRQSIRHEVLLRTAHRTANRYFIRLLVFHIEWSQSRMSQPNVIKEIMFVWNMLVASASSQSRCGRDSERSLRETFLGGWSAIVVECFARASNVRQQMPLNVSVRELFHRPLNAYCRREICRDLCSHLDPIGTCARHE